MAVLLAALTGACARAAPVLPEPHALEYHRVPWEDAFPSDAVVDDRGRLWFTDRLTHALGRYDPDPATFRRYPTPSPRSAPYGLVRGPDGALWFGESNGRRLGRLDPETGAITEIEVPGLAHGPQLLAWSGGLLWFTSRRDGVIGRYDPVSGEARLWRDRVPEPYGIAATPDGRVWVAAHGGSTLHRVDILPDSGEAVDYTEPGRLRVPQEVLDRLSPEQVERFRNPRIGIGIRRIAAGPDGRLWAAGHRRGRVLGIDPDTGDRRTLASLDPSSQPYAVGVDPWGRVWYSEQGTDGIVVYDPGTDRRLRYPLPLRGGTVRDLAIDADRSRVWLPMSDLGVIAVVELGSP